MAEGVFCVNIGLKLKQHREAKGMSLYRLAQLSDIAQNNIQKIEDGASMPTIDTLQKLLPNIGLTLSELFNDSEEHCFVTKTEKECLLLMRTLNPEQTNHILEAMKLMGKSN